MPAPEYPRRRDEGWEEAFVSFLRDREDMLGRAAKMDPRTLRAIARVAAGDFGGTPVNLDGSVAGAVAGAALKGVLVRARFAPVAELLAAASRAQLEAEPNDVLAVHAHVSENLAAPVDDFAVGFLRPGCVVQAYGIAAGRPLSMRLSLLLDAVRELSAVGAPPRSRPLIVLNDDHLGAAAGRLPELARSAVLVRRPADDVLAGDAALAETTRRGVRLIPERDLAIIDDYLFPAHLLADAMRAEDRVDGKLDALTPVMGSTWRVLAPLNPERPAGERAPHALKRPKDLLFGISGVMPEPWHQPIASTSFACGNAEPREGDCVARERFVCIRGLADIFDAFRRDTGPRGAPQPING